MAQFLEHTWRGILIGIAGGLLFHLVRSRVPNGERLIRAFAFLFPAVVAVVLLIRGKPVSRWIVIATIAIVVAIAAGHGIGKLARRRGPSPIREE